MRFLLIFFVFYLILKKDSGIINSFFSCFQNFGSAVLTTPTKILGHDLSKIAGNMTPAKCYSSPFPNTFSFEAYTSTPVVTNPAPLALSTPNEINTPQPVLQPSNSQNLPVLRTPKSRRVLIKPKTPTPVKKAFLSFERNANTVSTSICCYRDLLLC